MKAARADFGRSLVGLLMVVVVLAGMGAAVLAASQDGTGENHHDRAGAASGTTLSPSPARAAADIGAAAAETCRADYQAVTQAVQYYQVLNGHPPADLASLGQFLKDPVSSPYFTISLSAGAVGVAAAGHPTVVGDSNCTYAGSAG